jgi:Spy/CpxP family protein refolding chaperone
MKAGKVMLALAAAGLLGIGSFAVGAGAADVVNSSPTTQMGFGDDSAHPFLRFIRGQVGRWMVLRSELDLTGDQKQQIAAVLKSDKPQIVAAIQPVVEKRRALRNAVMAASPDEKTIRADADELGQAIGNAAVVASQIKQQIAPILTDEQKQKLTDFRSQSDSAVDSFLSKAAGGQ